MTATQATQPIPTTPGHRGVAVSRGTRSSYVSACTIAVIVAVLAALPWLIGRGTQVQLVGLFGLVVLGTMWNLLAGYGGMVSIGQQAYIGVGAYGLVYLADKLGLNPFLAVPVAAVLCAALALPTTYLVFRLAGGYFAIGTWVAAEVVRLVTTQIPTLGAGSGTSLGAFGGTDPVYRIAYVYWMALMVMVVSVLGVYLLMRSRLGLALTAIRDDPTAAGSLGVQVTRAKRLVYVVAAAGCGLAGATIAANTLRVQPDSIYSVNYSAYMILIVLVGGIGTIEGPIVGAVVFFVLREWLSDLGSWYLILLGLIAICMVLFAPRGLWGLISRGRLRAFPVGYHVRL